MSYFLLPSIPYNKDIVNLISQTYTNNDNNIIINKTLSRYLSKIKGQIDSKQHEWDKYKKYTNPYEYIHTVIPGSKYSICKTKPLSRSYFKMIEICKSLKLLDSLPDVCKTYHLAEGPGGFIEAIANMRENMSDQYFGITLVNDDDTSVPGWKKSQAFLKKHTNVIIETGASKTGDLMDPENLKYMYQKHHNTCHLVTADGGFDFTTDFNHQELVSLKLILSQIAFAIACQKKGGSFFIKMFDTFTPGSIDMLYLLSMLYDQVYFCKPHTSRYANSEKYIICKGFRVSDTKPLVISLYHLLQSFADNTNNYLDRIFTFDIPYVTVNRIEEYNAIFGQQQIECISQTLGLINGNNYDRIENMKKSHIQKCVSWCQKYKLPYNKMTISTNIFLSGRKRSESVSKECLEN